MRAALYINGKIVTGDSHLSCWQRLSEEEQNSSIDSGFFDQDSGQFISEHEREFLDKKELYMVRHGHSVPCDDPDPDIDSQGILQSNRVAEILSRQNLDGFCGITSPLLRCLRTASIIKDALGITFTVVPEIMETPHFLKNKEVFKLKNRADDFPQFVWPSSHEWHVLPETPLDFYRRVKDVLHNIHDHSIVITHFGFINLTAKIALCKQLFSNNFPLASITYFYKHDCKRLGWTNEEIL